MKRTSRLLTSAACTVVAVIISNWLLGRGAAGAPGIAIALAPLPFVVWFIHEEIKWLRSNDEFHRRVVLEALGIAFPLAIFIGIAVEAVQKAGFLADVGIGAVWPWMALTFLPSLFYVYRRYDRDE